MSKAVNDQNRLVHQMNDNSRNCVGLAFQFSYLVIKYLELQPDLLINKGLKFLESVGIRMDFPSQKKKKLRIDLRLSPNFKILDFKCSILC